MKEPEGSETPLEMSTFVTCLSSLNVNGPVTKNLFYFKLVLKRLRGAPFLRPRRPRKRRELCLVLKEIAVLRRQYWRHGCAGA